MSGMDIKWGPWIRHDGKGFPEEVWQRATKAGASRIEKRMRGPGRMKTPREQADERGRVDSDHPGWTWRRKYLFFGPWVASDPAYARIVACRFGFPRGSETEANERVEMLKAIAAGARQPDQEKVDT